jgi:hypothetical protein
MLTRSSGVPWGRWGSGLLLLGLVVQACSGEPERPIDVHVDDPGGARPGNAGENGEGATGPESGGTGTGGAGTGGTGGSSGGTGGSSGSDPLAPIVEITSPSEVEGPNDSGVIVDDEIDVLCTVTPTKDGEGDEIASVIIEMLDADDKVVERYPATPTATKNEYTAHFFTQKVDDNGRFSFTCSGEDAGARVGRDRIDSFIDHGPTIVPVLPAPEDGDQRIYATPLDQVLEVLFRVEEAAVADGDEGAAIGDVELSVALVGAEYTEEDGEYSATVHLNDPVKYFTPPDGTESIIITARNRREPTPATATFRYDFIVDSTGPEIEILSPGPGPYAGDIDLIFTVSDEQSGVDSESVVAIINGETYPFIEGDGSWSDLPAGTFTFHFDTTKIASSTAQATIQVKASDLAANEAEPVTVRPYLDNVPPIVELDPLPIRDRIKASSTCSVAYDPVGPRAASDLEVVKDFKVFRAVVWDETNHASGDPNGRAASADQSSAVILLQPHPEQGLLKDDNGDGVCDTLIDKDTETGESLQALNLVPIPPQGASWFGVAENENETLDELFPKPGDCIYGTSTAPPTLCPPTNSSDLTRVIHWDIYAEVPAIYGVPPLEGVNCTGDGWEIKSGVQEGWICLAGMARDNVRNQGISRPIRLCYDDQTGAPPTCEDQESDPPPSCVIDDCELPPRLGSFTFSL